MGKNLYSDFAVLTAAGRAVDFMQVAESLRIIPLFDAISLVDAMKGLKDHVMGVPYYNGSEGDPGSFVPLNAAGADVSNVTIQHDSDGYVRFVGKLQVPNVEVDPDDPDPDPVVISHVAKGFALVDLSRTESSPEQGHIYGEIGGKSDDVDVLAVASIDRGYDMGNECYVSFTITTVNNYKSVTFNPNAFATMEDLSDINGLDGLHIAFDTNSGDIKLLDKDGKVLDQANLHMDTDTIIAEGEEGYKYVKTDIDQDIHSVKAFMPDGMSAFDDVDGQDYEVQNAALLVDLRDLRDAVDSAESALEEAESDLADAQEAVDAAQQALDANDDPDAVPALEEALSSAQSTLSEKASALEEARDAVDEATADFDEALQAARHGDYTNVMGIRVISDQGESITDYFIGGSYNNSKVGASDVPFLAELESDIPEGFTPVYSPAAFVWTVGKDVGGEPDVDPNFAQQMNAHAQALGFHIGDDIPLGTNLENLIGKMSDGDFDAEAYIHDTIVIDDEEYTSDELVDEQRNLAKAELVAWNAQHPALALNELEGTRVGKDGVDIRNGNIRIGNGKRSAFPYQYDIATNIGDTEHTNGLQIGVIDSSYGGGNSGTPRNIVTINKDDYISGAPICMILAQFYIDRIQQADLPDIVTPGVLVKRKTANFSVSVPDDLAAGTFELTINDTRPDVEQAMGTFGLERIIEIVPVYTPGADTSEAVPALQPIHAIGRFQGSESRSLTVQCSQVLDWANSLGIDGTGNGDQPSLFLIVKVY